MDGSIPLSLDSWPGYKSLCPLKTTFEQERGERVLGGGILEGGFFSKDLWVDGTGSGFLVLCMPLFVFSLGNKNNFISRNRISLYASKPEKRRTVGSDSYAVIYFRM